MAFRTQLTTTCFEVGWIQTTRKSVTCYVLSLNGEPVSWKAKRQDCVTLSSAEAEYVTASM